MIVGPKRIQEPFSLSYDREPLEAEADKRAKAKHKELLEKYGGYENRGARSAEFYYYGMLGEVIGAWHYHDKPWIWLGGEREPDAITETGAWLDFKHRHRGDDWMVNERGRLRVPAAWYLFVSTHNGHYDIAIVTGENVAQWELYYPTSPNTAPFRKWPKPEEERWDGNSHRRQSSGLMDRRPA